MPLQTSEIWWLIILGTTITVSFAIFFISTIAVNQRRFIKAQKEKLVEVRKSEAKYSDLFNNVTDVVFIHSLDGRILEINASALSLLNIAAGEIIGKPLKELFNEKYYRRIDSYLMEIRLRGEANGLFSLRRADGKKLIFEYRNSLIKKNETSVAIRGIARDITEQRQIELSLRASEIRFRHLVKYSPLPMIIHSARVIRYANDAAVKLIRAAGINDVVGKIVDDVIILGYFPVDGEPVRENGDRNHPTIQTEKLRQLSDQLVDVETASLPVFFEGKPAVHTVIRDITRSKQLEAKLREMPKQIIDAQEQERGRVSRDLHDGVNQILGSVQFRLLAAEPVIAPVAKLSNIDIARIQQDLNAAIDEIKRISHNLRPSILDDLGLFAAVRNMCEDFQRNTSITVDCTFDEFAERMSPDKEVVFFRIIQEALHNIQKHAKATHVTVGITADEDLFLASIIDNGRGFALQTVKPSNGEKHGLGLHTMKERATFVGGSTAIQSEPHHGTRITVRIPREKIEVA